MTKRARVIWINIWGFYFGTVAVIWITACFAAVYMTNYADSQPEGWLLVAQVHCYWQCITWYAVTSILLCVLTRYHNATRSIYEWFAMITLTMIVSFLF